MTTVAPTPDRLVSSLARQVRNSLLASEQQAAGLVIADFEDALQAADDDRERVAICRRWQRWLADLRHEAE